jgi:methionyl-tRNA synthetase
MDQKTISFDDFQKLDIRVGTILSAERVSGSDKLLKLSVDMGEENARQIIAGIAEYIAPESLAGVQCPFAANLEPRIIRGLESQGMILAIGTDQGFALLHPSAQVPTGSRVK